MADTLSLHSAPATSQEPLESEPSFFRCQPAGSDSLCLPPHSGAPLPGSVPPVSFGNSLHLRFLWYFLCLKSFPKSLPPKWPQPQLLISLAYFQPLGYSSHFISSRRLPPTTYSSKSDTCLRLLLSPRESSCYSTCYSPPQQELSKFSFTSLFISRVWTGAPTSTVEEQVEERTPTQAGRKL